MVADLVAFRMSPEGQRPAAGPREFFANDEESSLNPACGENVNHAFRDPRRRPVVESKCYALHVNHNFRWNSGTGGIVHRGLPAQPFHALPPLGGAGSGEFPQYTFRAIRLFSPLTFQAS